MRATIVVLLAAVHVLGSPVDAQVEPQRQTVQFGVVLDGPWQENERIRGLFESEIADLLGREFDVRFPSEFRREGDWTLAGVRIAVDDLLAGPAVDILLALGPISSHLLAGRSDIPKPTVATFVVDAELQGLPSERGVSGIPNLSYVAIPAAVHRDLAVFREIASFERLAFLVNPGLLNAIPGLTVRARQAVQAAGIAIEIVPVVIPLENTLQSLPEDIDAAYVTPLTHLTSQQWRTLVDSLTVRRLPTFSYLGVAEVQAGLLASLTPDTFFQRLARRTALNVQRILLGEAPSELPVAFSRDERLTINMATARAIGMFPSWTVLTEAVLLNEEAVPGARRLTLTEAAREAVARNLDLSVEDRVVAAGAYDVQTARAQLLPQVEVSSQTTLIDEDRAAASLGSQAQRTFSGGGSVRQLIFSEQVWANTSIQRRLQDARVQVRSSVELDVALDASGAYLNVLRALTVERIRRDNLRVTRSNLELAQVRRSIGTAGPGEVYRWQSELARARQDVLAAEAQHRITVVTLNRALNRPLEQPLDLQDVTVDDPVLLTSDPRLLEAVDNPYAFTIFRDFLVHEGLRASPELRQIDAAREAQQRLVSSTTNSFWAPTIALQADLSSTLAEGGVGAAGFQVPGLPPDVVTQFPQANDLSWSLGLRVSLPLFQGGSRFAARAQAVEDLSRLRIQREAVAQGVEQRIRSALHATSSSFPGISLSREAAEAARRNLDVVTDAYSRGVATVLDLLDAQNAALVADLAAANAVYDFLLDLMVVQRAMARFDFFLTADERKAFFQRLERFYEEAGIPLTGR